MNEKKRKDTESYIRNMLHNSGNTRYAVKCDKEQLEKIKKLFHDKKPYGMTNAEFLIKVLEEVK